MRRSAIYEALVLMLAAALTACGGGNSMQTTVQPIPTANAQSAAAVVNISDAPSDRLIEFELTVNSVTLTKSDGTAVNVLASPRRVELTHLAGTTQPLILNPIPQGTYVSATVVVSAPEVTFINNAGQTVERENPAFTDTLNISISPPLIVGSGPVVLTFDVNARNSVSIDLATGNVSITPSISILTANVPLAGHEGEEEVEDGQLEHIIGQVTAVSSNSFTIKIGQSDSTLTFSVNSTTRFDEGMTFASVVMGSIVRVEGVTQQDGTTLATEIEVIGANAAQESEGVITATSGNPVSTFTLVLQDGTGTNMSSGMVGSSIQVQVSSSTQFRIDNGNLDLSGWSLPQFTAASLSKAQRVEIDGAAIIGGTVNASVIKLEQQALSGTVSAFSNSQFTLTVSADSAFALLTGMTTVTVYTGKSAQIDSGVSLANGATVKVRGLLLLDSSKGSYVLVASRLAQP